jgi:very-short-patch-repair endonuclease
MARIDAAIAERAGQQLGLITHAQLEEIGCSRQMRRTRISDRRLIPIAHRVLRLAGSPCTWEQALLAATLEAGAAAVVSHMSAAALWGFADLRRGAIELSIPLAHCPRLTRGRLHRVDQLISLDVSQRSPFALTTPERTLIDIASRLSHRRLELILDSAARDGLLTAGSAADALARLRASGRHGIKRLAEVVGDPASHLRTDSWLERRTLQLIRAAGLPTPCTQRWEATSSGPARVDLLYEAERLVVEIDGHATHSTRRQRQADAEREAALVLRGWRVIRFTYEDVTERPAYVVDTIRRHLDLATS